MHIYRLFFLLAILQFKIGNVHAQYSYKDIDKRMVLVKTDDDIIEAAVYDGFKVKKILPDRNYYWYDHNMIMSTKGGFTGELLHGDFLIQYRNYQIKEQGKFNFGLKKGMWKRWHSTGLPKEFITYKNGVLHGPYSEFDSTGNLKEKGNYKNGYKEGLVVQYSNDKKDKLKFKQGALISAPSKPARDTSAPRKDGSRKKEDVKHAAKKTVQQTKSTNSSTKTKESKPEKTNKTLPVKENKKAITK